MSDAVCDDCLQAERQIWPVYTTTRWCCRARWIVDATTSRSHAGQTIEHARRSLAEREKWTHPGDWERVRARLVALAAIADASQSHEKGSSAPRNESGGMRVATDSNEALKRPESERGLE
jgi:hypothetical protein